jgi:hypothetical protein
MTLTLGNRISLSPGDWIKVLTFLAVQTAALVGVGVDMRERLVIVETRLAARDDNLREMRSELSVLRNEFAELRRNGK